MKDLKENTAYYLGDLNDEQFKQVAIWFMENKNDIQLFSSSDSAFEWIKNHTEDKSRLSKYKNSKYENVWGFRKTDYKEVNALTLFTEIDFETMRKSTLEQLSKYTPFELIEYYEKELGVMKKYSSTHEDVKAKIKEFIKSDDMVIDYNVLKVLHNTNDTSIRITNECYVSHDNTVYLDGYDGYIKVKTWGELRQFLKFIK